MIICIYINIDIFAAYHLHVKKGPGKKWRNIDAMK